MTSQGCKNAELSTEESSNTLNKLSLIKKCMKMFENEWKDQS